MPAKEGGKHGGRCTTLSSKVPGMGSLQVVNRTWCKFPSSSDPCSLGNSPVGQLSQPHRSRVQLPRLQENA